MNDTSLTPKIDYSHVLTELSVNRQDPCEIIRELISNSYDAGASKIYIYPLEEFSGFIFIDNGHGLSTSLTNKGISHYQAFFSIGKTTKTKGDCIGYKCQGTKLCFASSEFTLLSKVEDSESWIYKKIDNPRANLNETTNISPETNISISEKLETLFKQADQRSQKVINDIIKNVKIDTFNSGTVIIIKNFAVDDYSKYFTVDPEQHTRSYIYNYIIFSTKHGDVRIVKDAHGFQLDQKKQLDGLASSFIKTQISLWAGEKLIDIPNGYPYITITQDTEEPLSPDKLSRLRSARFYSRHAKVIRFQNNKFSFILSIDGNRRALERYNDLDRQGSGGARSGLKLTDQRGTYLASSGIKTCHYAQLWDAPELKDYLPLKDNDAQSHYLFIIDGPFDLVTNRNSVSSDASKILKDPAFISQIKDFLDEEKQKSSVFKELISRLNSERTSDKRDAQIKALEETKKGLLERERFRINDIEQLKNKWFVSPDSSDEHWVGALYTLLGHFVPTGNSYQSLWLRPLTFSARGIDSIGTISDEMSLEADKMLAIEYKNRLNHKEPINHPLNVMNYIVCWDYEAIISNTDMIEDEFDCFGTIKSNPKFNECSYIICDIESKKGRIYDNHTVTVISLRNLIEKTFDVKFTQPPIQQK